MRLAPIACALVLVLAGCGAAPGGPSPTATPTEPPTDAPTTTPSEGEVEVPIGDLPFDPDPVFDRVLNLTGEDVAAPSVYAYDSAGPTAEPNPAAFQQALGITSPEELIRADGFASPDGDVEIYEQPSAANSTAAVESTLAHEFVHVVQIRSGWTEAARSDLPTVGGEPTFDAGLAYGALVEGVATHYQGKYDRAYLPTTTPAPTEQMDRYQDAPAYYRLVLGGYAFGSDYAADRLAAGEDLESLHRDPPVSTEQVLHHTDDPIAPLNVSTADSGEWAVESRDTQGELFLRAALRTELNRSTAVDAAHGWGNDRRITYERGAETGTAWVLRWDDAANASEFESSFRRYLDAKATRNGSVWHADDRPTSYRIAAVTDRTTVVYLGDEPFVRDANATAESDGGVEIVVGNKSG